MTDPRDIAHDKKVRQEKKKRGEELAPGADKTPQLGKKTHKEHHASDTPKVPDEAAPVPTGEKLPTDLGSQRTCRAGSRSIFGTKYSRSSSGVVTRRPSLLSITTRNWWRDALGASSVSWKRWFWPGASSGR